MTEHDIDISPGESDVLLRFRKVLRDLYAEDIPEDQIIAARSEHSKIFTEAYELGLVNDLIKIAAEVNLIREMNE